MRFEHYKKNVKDQEIKVKMGSRYMYLQYISPTNIKIQFNNSRNYRLNRNEIAFTSFFIAKYPIFLHFKI